MRTISKVLTATALTVATLGTGFAASATAAEPLSKKEFLAKANAICDAKQRDADAISAKVFAGSTEDAPPSAAAIASFVEQAMPGFRRALAKLAALDGPDALEQKVDKVVAAYRSAVKDIEADPQAMYEEPGEFLYKPDALAGKIGIDCAGDYYADGVAPPVRG